MSAWAVTKGKVELPSGMGAWAGCHHQKKGACGGCYARLHFAMDDARVALEADRAGKALDVLQAVQAAMRADGPKKRGGQ